MNNNFSWLMQISPWLSMLIFPIRLLLGLFLAVVVFRNGKRREALEYRIPPMVWSFLVLIDPVFGLIAYWLINRDAPYREPADEDA
jgi:hypothetical protein